MAPVSIMLAFPPLPLLFLLAMSWFEADMTRLLSWVSTAYGEVSRRIWPLWYAARSV